jgi:ketosteroid isomerase-like protein
MLTRRTSLLALAALVACAPATRGDLIDAAAFSAWLDRYKLAWEARDAAQAGALFTADASYHEMPFDAPMQGRAAIETYWSRVTATQADVRFTYEVMSCAGDRGICRWHATFKSAPGGETIDLDGVFVCAFADARTVKALQEWWHVRVTQATAPAE